MATDSPSSRAKAMTWTASIFILIALVAISYWLFYARFYEYTDDAYVDGNQIVVTSAQPGIILSFSVYDGDFVEQGRTLIQLDTTDALIALEKAKAQLGNTLRDVVILFENALRDSAYVEVNDAAFIKAAQDYDHRKAVINDGGVSLEDFEHAKAALHSAFFSWQASVAQSNASNAAIENSTLLTHPRVQAAISQLKHALVTYHRCTIKAPASGLIGQRSAQVGEHVNAGASLMTIIPLNELWITANYKEVQLKSMRIGQPVEVTADIYGSKIVYPGTIEGIGGGTGSVYSLLPPQNATGNWIKIVQRVPVRIVIDQEVVKRYPLRKGLSVEATAHIKDQEGPYIPAARPNKPLRSTDVFDDELEGIEEMIQQVIEANLGQLP